MIIRVTTFIDIETDDAETTCMGLHDGLENALSNFPQALGEIISADVDGFREIKSDEIKELGYEAE